MKFTLLKNIVCLISFIHFILYASTYTFQDVEYATKGIQRPKRFLNNSDGFERPLRAKLQVESRKFKQEVEGFNKTGKNIFLPKYIYFLLT